MFQASDIIQPQDIVSGFGRMPIGVTLSSPGHGGPDDGNFMDLSTEWQPAPVDATILREVYFRALRAAAILRAANLLVFHWWPEIRFRDDGAGMVYSRLCFVRADIPKERPK